MQAEIRWDEEEGQGILVFLFERNDSLVIRPVLYREWQAFLWGIIARGARRTQECLVWQMKHLLLVVRDALPVRVGYVEWDACAIYIMQLSDPTHRMRVECDKANV
jgi:hypothetical protein